MAFDSQHSTPMALMSVASSIATFAIQILPRTTERISHHEQLIWRIGQDSTVSRNLEAHRGSAVGGALAVRSTSLFCFMRTSPVGRASCQCLAGLAAYRRDLIETVYQLSCPPSGSASLVIPAIGFYQCGELHIYGRTIALSIE